jgi:hypothetical protein
VSLIATAISQLGIVQASDSNITAEDKLSRQARKVFRIPSVGGALALAGTYRVGGAAMDAWMPAAIDAYGAMSGQTLSGFAEFLRERLSKELTAEEHAMGTLVHIAGYVEVEGAAHPEFWFVRNIAGMDEVTGDYIGQERFDISEDFWTRDYQTPEVRAALAGSFEQRYFNGYAAGRIAYLGFIQRFRAFLGQVWAEPTWSFRQPTSIEELARFIELEIQFIGTLFFSSDYAAPYIGGQVQIEKIPAPPNAIPL